MKYIPLFLVISLALSCSDNNECGRMKYCSNSGKCEHMGVTKIDGLGILGSCLIFVASGLANAGGIGGGPIMVIILITLFDFDAKESVPLSQLIIFGGSLIAILIKVFLRHPVKKRPLIDFDIALLLASPLLIGTSIGVIINLIIPQWLILALLTVLLCYISVDSIKTAIKIYKKENTTKTSVKFLSADSGLFTSEDEAPINEGLKEIYRTESKTVPPKSLFLICVVFLFVVFTSFIRGSLTFSSIFGIEFCSTLYWIVSILVLFILLAISIYSGYMMMGKYVYKKQIGYDFDTMDLAWNARMIFVVCCSGLIAGMAAGIVGVGGGLVMNPVMLKLGLRPEVSTATSSFMVLFTSTISMLQYAIAGKLSLDYGLWTLMFSIVGSCLGILVIKKLVEKYKRSSIIVMLLGIILLTCAVIVPAYGIVDYVSSSKDDGFSSYCS